jgi:hypothetical protein
MIKLLRHLILPAIVPGLFLLVASTPVTVLGCRNRGLLAVAITFLGLGGAAAAVYRVHVERRRGGGDILWWTATALILMVPAVGLLLLA